MYKKIVLGMALAGAANAADLVRRDTGGGGGHSHGGGHDHGHAHAAPAAAPSSGYSEPAASSSAGYGAPSAGYGAPAPAASYGAPSGGYGAPAQSYGAPSGGSSYSSPSSGYGYDVGGYEEEGGFDLSAIIIPILIIFGLSLLFPTITSVSVRRKRDLEAAANPMTDVVERVNDIYLAVVESEECMERIACEIGGLAADVGLQENSLTKMASPMVPLKYKKFLKQFEAGKDCHKLKCGQLF